MMKKTIAILVSLLLSATCFVGCEEGELVGDGTNIPSAPVTSTVASGDSSVVDSTSADSTSGDVSDTGNSVADTSIEDSSVVDTSNVAGETIVGSWEMKMDITQMLAGELTEELGLGDALSSLSPVIIKQTFSFEKDGILRYNNNIDSIAKDYDDLLKAVSGIISTVTGADENTMYDGMKSAFDLQALKAELPSGTSTYTLSDNIVVITTIEDDGEKDVEKYTYSYSNGTLTLTDEDGESMEFTKA